MSLLSRNPAGAGLTVAAAVATLCAVAPAGAAEIFYQPIVQLSTQYNTNLDLSPLAADKRSGECAKCMRQRGPLRHRRHGHPKTHREADNRADCKPDENPCIRDDLVVHQRADDRHQHAEFGEMHAPFCCFGMAQALQSDDEQD